MNWIKKNPAQFGLAAVSVLLLASSYFLWAEYSKFPEQFSESQRSPSPKKEMPAIDTTAIDQAYQSIDKPEPWTPKKSRLLASKLYVAKEGKLTQPIAGTVPLLPPMDNVWVLKHGLDLLNPATAEDDPDRDGFSNRVEWDGMDGVSHNSEVPPHGRASGPDGQPLPEDMTDPNDPKSHPPYHTRLALEKVVNIPFRMRFMSYDINPRKPEEITVQINAVDLRRTQFVELGKDIPGTKFKTERFEKKEAPGADGITVDVSELIVINKETNSPVVLPLGRVVDSPESYVVIKYLWKQPGGQDTPLINKQKGQTFTIPPEADKTYKVIDIRGEEVDIQLPSGQKYTLRKRK